MNFTTVSKHESIHLDKTDHENQIDGSVTSRCARKSV